MKPSVNLIGIKSQESSYIESNSFKQINFQYSCIVYSLRNASIVEDNHYKYETIMPDKL